MYLSIITHKNCAKGKKYNVNLVTNQFDIVQLSICKNENEVCFFHNGHLHNV